MNNNYSSTRKESRSHYFVITKYISDILRQISEKSPRLFDQQRIIVILLLLGFTFSGYSQQNKEILPLVCVKKIDAGLFQATFSYENPTKKEVVIDENGSIIKFNNGKKIAKGLNKFKPGLNKKAFTKEFGPGDFIEWTITSNGKTKTVVANVNSGYCEPDNSFIFPVIGNGKSFDIIGQELGGFCNDVVGETPSELIFQIINEKVLVEIVPIAGKLEEVVNLLRTPEFNVGNEDYLLYDPDNPSIVPEVFLSGLSAIDVLMQTDVLCSMNNYPELINFARPVYPSIKNAFGDGFTGDAVTQGDAAQTSDIVRESFKIIDSEGNVLPVDGTGITIGVMSNSYDTQPFSAGNDSKATIDVKQGDLPGIENTHGYNEPVNVIEEYPNGVASDEGRAMMHIIHDVAPGAQLAFYASSLSPRKFEVGFNELAGLSDIIVDDITFVTEPFFGEGRISTAINAFIDSGGMHFTSAGNFGDKAYQSIFNPSTDLPTTNFIDPGLTKAHVFGTNADGTEDYLQKISVVPGTYMIALQWKENAASQVNELGASDDLDIYIVDDFGRLLVGSNRVNIEGDPTEVIVFKATGTGDANILITSANGATNVPFRFIAFESNGLTWEYNTTGTPTVSGHAMTENSVAVGAIRYNKTDPEVFSSFGGSLPDGAQIDVDFAAPDGVDTNVGSIGIKYFSNGEPTDETPEYPNFFGTSAAAPSAAAVVALLQSALPTWYPDISNPGKSSISSSEVIDLFKTNVRDGSSPNPQAGAGMIDANKVFNSLAEQTARITSFDFVPVTDEENASISTVRIRIIGEFLPTPTSETEPVVYLDGEPVPFTVIDGVIYADIPPFTGNPDLQIFTQAKEGSEGNGGFSEPYKFFQDGKNILNITANPMTVKFGEAYKSKLTYTVEGIELSEGETYATLLANLGFPDVVLSTVADDVAYPDVKNYSITPSFDGDFADTDADGVPDVDDQCPMTPNGEQVDVNGCSDVQKGAADFTPATTYKVNFINDILVIEKNNLMITPKEITSAEYGEKIIVELDYSGFGTTNDAGVESFELIDDPDAFLSKIKAQHLGDFYVDGTTGITPVGLINNFKPGEALDANGVDRYQDILDLLENGSWISSANTFLNRLEQVPYRGGLYPENAGFTERVYGSVNTDLETAFINFNPLDFTAYLDYFNPDGSSILDGQSIGIVNGQALGIINGQALGIINGQAIGIINGQALGIINGQAIGIINGQAIGIVNGQAIGIINGQSIGIINGQAFGIINGQAFGIINNDSGLGSGLDTNDYNKVFSVIDNTDYTADCLSNGNCTISQYHALNLITGIEATNSHPHHIFPGSFINPMSDNFNILYKKAALTIDRKDLTVETAALSIPYGDDIAAEITTQFDFAYDDDAENVFPEGIPYYFESTDASDTQSYELGDKMKVGTYLIKIKDEADNYNLIYSNDHGQLTITEATLTLEATTAENIKYGEVPSITTVISGFPYDDEDISTLFPTDEIPYFFMKKGETPDCDTCIKYYLPYVAGADKMDVGEYDIFISDDPSDNYKIIYAPSDERGTLTVDPAILTVTTAALTLAYGDAVSEHIQTTISGYKNGENNATVFPGDSGGILIPYIFTDETGSALAIESVKERGTYTIEVAAPASGNYEMAYGSEHGNLTIGEASLTFTSVSETIEYGETPIIEPNFVGFADGETQDILKVDGKIPYFFMKDGVTFTLAELSNMNAGNYEIFITDDVTDNYTFSPDTNLGTLTINKATLEVEISPYEVVVNEGDIPVFTTTFVSGSAYGEEVNDVFPSGVPYEFEDEFGDLYLDTSQSGVFVVRIADPENYIIQYTNEARVFINAYADKKIRTYADCVSYDANAPDGLNYTVVFRYENDNDSPVYVLDPGKNYVSPGDNYAGILPTTFMPGGGTFEIRFDGSRLTWSLETLGSVNNSSVSSANNDGTGECDAKLDEGYLVYPNPVTDFLSIRQNIAEMSDVYILNLYGAILYQESFDGNNNGDIMSIDMTQGYPGGLYIVRIVSDDHVRTYNIIKQ